MGFALGGGGTCLPELGHLGALLLPQPIKGHLQMVEPGEQAYGTCECMCVYLTFIGNLLYAFDCTAVFVRQLKQDPSFSSKESKIHAVM